MINRLRIKNFRSLKDVDINPGRVNIESGPAGSGKTSIVEAIRYALTGVNMWTDDRGVGIKTQVSLGQKKADIQVDWVDENGEVHPFARTVPPPSGVKALQERIDKVLGVPSDVVAAQLSTRRFLSLPAKAQEDLLQGILSPPLDVDRWIAELSAWDEKIPDLGTWFDPHFDKIPPKKTLLEYAEMERRAAKKVRDDVASEIRVKEAAPAPEVVTHEDVEAMREQYHETTTRLATLRERASGGADVFTAQHAAWRQLNGQHDAAAAEVERLIGEITTAQRKDRPAQPSPSSAELVEQVAAQEAKVAEIKTRLDANNGEYDALVAGSGKCKTGTCARSRMEEIGKHLVAVRTEHEAAQVDLRKLEAARKEAEQAEGTLRLMAMHEEQLHKNLEAAEARLAALPPLGEEPLAPQSDPDIATLEERQASLKQQGQHLAAKRAAYEAWERDQAALDGRREKLAQLEDEVARWEAVFAAVGPRGVKSKLMGQNLQQLVDDVSGLLTEYFGAQFRIVPDPWAVEVNQGDGWLPAEQVSWSWQARVSACFQRVLAERTGVPLVVLDETGADPLVRSDLITLFDDSAGIQAWILSTAQRVTESGEFIVPAPEPEDAEAGVLTWWVEDGTARLVEARQTVNA